MKVVITGMGVMSSLGNSVDEMFTGLLENRTGVKGMPEWQKYVGLHTHLAAPAMPYDEKVISRTARRTMSRMSEMATLATMQALRQADLAAPSLGNRSLLLMGSTTGSPWALEEFFGKLAQRGGPEGQLGTTFFKVMNHTTASNTALAVGFSGPVLSPSSACATSGQTIAQGWEMIQSGLYDVVIAGGADELHYTTAAVFDIVGAASRATSPESSPRPFDRDRDGLVVSEGAAVVILESEDHARARGARPLATLVSGSYFCDGEHMSQPRADSMVKVMEMALSRAHLPPRAIGYVNAHATGTQLGDAEEAKATQLLFGADVPTSSLKGHFGHSLAACGALEVIACVEMMNRRVLIPTRNLETPAPDCVGAHLLREIRPADVKVMMSNNFAFGGMNTSLIIESSGEE